MNATHLSSNFLAVNSFVEMAKYLLQHPPVTHKAGTKPYILSARFNQDKLENYFGKVRMAGGRSRNPDVRQMLNISDSLRVQGSMALEPFRGNSSRKRRVMDNPYKDIQAEISDPLPKRKRHV